MDVFSYQSVRLDAALVVLLIIFGVVANTAAIGAILRTKLRRYAQSQYLLALLPVRQIMLVILMYSFIPNLWHNSYMGCLIVEMVSSFSSFAQAWLLVVMCAEPVVQSYLPQSTKLARRRSQLFIFCVITIAIVFALFSGMKTTAAGSESELKRMCYWKEWRLVSISHAIACLALPLVAALVLSTRRPPEPPSTNDEQESTQQPSSAERRKRRQTQPERIRFVAAFSHFFFVLPFYTLFGFAAATADGQVSGFFHTLAFYLLYIDLASTLPLYCLCWPQFRKSLNACWWSEDGPPRSHPPKVRPRKARSTRKSNRQRRKIHRKDQSSEHAERTSEFITDIVSL
uniref:G-protein coupled receptors family 1 profile domain-containing protein n=1 Tax=Plectus sambesii TaxID=2011161 RepID=A0A914UID6_9BILA